MRELEQDEYVVKYIRKHWIFMLLQVLSTLIIFLLPTVFAFLFKSYVDLQELSLFGITLSSITDILINLWAIACFLFLSERFTKYALNFWILTNKRIIESELHGLFNRTLSTLSLEDVEDTTIKVNGFLQNFLGFGTLEVQTAGTEREFRIQNVHHPVLIQKLIFDLKLKQKSEEKMFSLDELEDMEERLIKEMNENSDEEKEQVQKSMNNFLHENIEPDFEWGKKDMKDLTHISDSVNEVEDIWKKNMGEALRRE